MQNFIERDNLTDESLRLVNGGDGSAIYGKDLKPDSEQTFIEVTFIEAPPSTSGGAIYYSSEGRNPCSVLS